LWLGLKRWGVSGAASVIEARVEELGGEPHEETVEERAVRLERSLKFQQQRQVFLNSPRGADAANKEFEGLRGELKRLTESIRDSTDSIALSLEGAGPTISILGLHRRVLIVHWESCLNTLRDAELDVALWDGPPPFLGFISRHEPRKLKSFLFKFDLLPTEQVVWISEKRGERTYTTNELAAFILKYYLDTPGEK
jgi:hypothetical protein